MQRAVLFGGTKGSRQRGREDDESGGHREQRSQTRHAAGYITGNSLIYSGARAASGANLPNLERPPRHPAVLRLPARRGAAVALGAARHAAVSPAGGRQFLSAL